MNPFTPCKNDQGYVLVTALLIMLVLTIIGVIATWNTSTELQIAGNEKVHKMTFYEAEAGSAIGVEALEQSLNCITDFLETDAANHYADLTSTDFDSDVRVFQQDSEYVLWNDQLATLDDILDDSKAALAFPVGNLGDGVEAGYIYYDGETSLLPGGALQMAAGYEGRGKSAAQGGVAKNYEIYSRFEGLVNSESIIILGWQHVIGIPEGNIYGWCD